MDRVYSNTAYDIHEDVDSSSLKQVAVKAAISGTGKSGKVY
jgi:hypothetical protein